VMSQEAVAGGTPAVVRADCSSITYTADSMAQQQQQQNSISTARHTLMGKDASGKAAVHAKHICAFRHTPGALSRHLGWRCTGSHQPDTRNSKQLDKIPPLPSPHTHAPSLPPCLPPPSLPPPSVPPLPPLPVPTHLHHTFPPPQNTPAPPRCKPPCSSQAANTEGLAAAAPSPPSPPPHPPEEEQEEGYWPQSESHYRG
jgi:hypothetical protein